MPPSAEPDPPGRWVSVHELAEWVYCPRAHYYARRLPAGSEDPSAAEGRIRGASYHAGYLTDALDREHRTDRWWVGALIGAGMIVAAFLILLPP